MNFKNHLYFSIANIIFIKKIKIFNTLNKGYWGHIILGSIIGSLLPDIDHPKSFLGKKIKFISKPISKIFGHRGITHSIFAIFICCLILIKNLTLNFLIPIDLMQSIIIGYINHILGDILTPSGVPLFWPINWKFKIPILKFKKNSKKEEIFLIIFLILSILYPFNINKIIKYFF